MPNEQMYGLPTHPRDPTERACPQSRDRTGVFLAPAATPPRNLSRCQILNIGKGIQPMPLDIVLNHDVI
jgi:hypothetical protein